MPATVTRKHTLAIVGLGMAVTPHAQSLLDLHSRVDVRWAYSRSEARCVRFSQHFPWPTTTRLESVLGDAAVETVLLLTPPASHLELGLACLEAGKHVLIEKPLGLTVAHAETLVAVAGRRQRRLGVVLQHRFHDSSRTLDKMLRQGELGELAMAACRVPWWRDQAYYDQPGRGTFARDGGGVLMTQAIHVLDLFRSLLGGELRVLGALAQTTLSHRMECEDFAAALLRTPSGTPASFMATTAAFPGFTESIELVGTLATARLAGTRLEVSFRDGHTYCHGSLQAPSRPGGPMDFSHAAHRALITDFLDALDEGRTPRASGAEALATQRLIDAILAHAGASASSDTQD